MTTTQLLNVLKNRTDESIPAGVRAEKFIQAENEIGAEWMEIVLHDSTTYGIQESAIQFLVSNGIISEDRI